MTEEDIVQALQPDLAPYRLKAIVKQKQSHLHVLLSRSEDISVDYDRLTKQVCTRLRTLQPQGVEMITIYGRISGQKQYEWERTRQLTAEETLVFDGSQMEEYLKELEMSPAEAEDPPTEAYEPQAQAPAPATASNIDHEEITLVMPPPSPPPSASDNADSVSSAPVSSGSKGPLSPGLIKLLAGVGAAVVVALIGVLILL